MDQFDQTYQDVKEFENHPVCKRFGWDANILRSLIDSQFMGGGYNRKDRVYVTTERYLIIAAREMIRSVRNRIEADSKISGLDEIGD